MGYDFGINNPGLGGLDELTATEEALIIAWEGGVLKLLETTAPSTVANYGQIYVKASDHLLYFKDASGTESAIQVGASAGANAALSNLASVAINTTLVSDTDNTDSLGTAAIGWSDLFLGNGAVITFSSAPSTSDVTITHSSNLLTIAGGDLALGTNSLTLTGSIAATGARVTKGWFTDIESTNMPTVGGVAIISDTAYGVGWNGSTAVAPSQNAVYDQVELKANIASPTFTGTVSVPATNFTVGASIPFSDTAGTLTLQNVDALDATTEATIEAAIDTLANLTSVQGQTLTLAGAFITSGANSLTLTTTGATNVTLPTTGTLATLAGTEELDNKTLDSSVGKGTWTASGTWTLPAVTAGGTITLAENSTIALDPAGSADGKYTGITITGTAGYAQTFGDLVYLDPTDSRWEKCDANSAAGADGDSRGIIGIVVVAGAADGNACTILLHGVIRADAAFPAFTINNPIYVSETAGAVTQTQPTTTDVVIRIVGFALTADEMYFNPENDYITHI